MDGHRIVRTQDVLTRPKLSAHTHEPHEVGTVSARVTEEETGVGAVR